MNLQQDIPEKRQSAQIDYENELNSSQYEAVHFDDGYLLVIAGAGSGKTRTLTYRVARLVEAGIAPRSILLLTFTRKASEEMIRRATNLLDKRCGGVSGGTFHSLANLLLRRHAHRVGYDSGFAILDRADSENLVGMIRKEDKGLSRSKSFPKKGTLVSIYSKAVNKMVPIEEEIEDSYAHLAPYAEGISEIYKTYVARKRELQYFDYDDLLIYLKLLLELNPALRESISATYRYIMVDEYQDTNTIQAEIVSLLSHAHHNVMAVGDDSQSIYAFRGANFKNIMNFPDIFPGTRLIRLEENYRSIQPILDLTNLIIESASEKYTKALFTRKKGGSVPLLVEAGSENEQSRYIVDTITDLQRQGIPLNQIAVLFRAGFHSFDLEIELGREGISFIKHGGFKFMESAHIKDLLSYLRVLHNPYDRISWHRILLLVKKIGPRTAETIYQSIVQEKSGMAGFLSLTPRPAWAEGFNQLKAFFAAVESKTLTVAEAGEHALNYYVNILKEIHDDYPKRIRDLEHLLTIMERYADLEHFLTDMALEPPTTSFGANLSVPAPENTADAENTLVLSTVHSAKGLEWHTVFIISALDGRFPSMRAIDSFEEMEEELRLMYVAATRAKENLVFTYPTSTYDRGSGMIFARPSRFLETIPYDMLDRIEADPW